MSYHFLLLLRLLFFIFLFECTVHPVHVSAQCRESSTSLICSDHGTCNYPATPTNITQGYDPLIEGKCQCQVARFEWDGTNSQKAERPFCSAHVQDLPGMTSYINRFILPIGALYLLLMIADVACLIKVAQAGEFRFNLRTVAMSLLLCKFFLNVIYFLVDPLNAHHVYGTVGGAWLALLAEPFIITSYNLVFVFLRDLSSRHLKRQFNNRTIYWVTCISFFISFALVGGTMAIGALWFYIGIMDVYIIISSVAMFWYSWKILKQLQAVNAFIYASEATSRVSHMHVELASMHSEVEVIAEHEQDAILHSHRRTSSSSASEAACAHARTTPTPAGAGVGVRLSVIIDSNGPGEAFASASTTPIPTPDVTVDLRAPSPAPDPTPTVTRTPIYMNASVAPIRARIRLSTSTAVQNDSRQAIRQVAKISLGSSIVWLFTGLLMLFLFFMGTTVTAKQYVMGFFAVQLCNIAWGMLMLACFWPRHEMRVDDGSILHASPRSLHDNNKKKPSIALKSMDERHSSASAAAAGRYQIPPIINESISTTPTPIKQSFMTSVKQSQPRPSFLISGNRACIA